MPDFCLIFRTPSASQPQIASIAAKDAHEAFVLAQRYGGPAELWSDDQHICTLDRAGDAGSMWVITRGA